MSVDIVSDLAAAIGELANEMSSSTTRKAEVNFAAAIDDFVDSKLRALNVIDAEFPETGEPERQTPPFKLDTGAVEALAKLVAKASGVLDIVHAHDRNLAAAIL